MRRLQEQQTPASDRQDSRNTSPSFHDSAKKKVFTKKSVPKGARRSWAQCLLQSITAVVAFNDLSSWQALHALPKCVLRGQVRGGAKRHRGETETKGLCRRWLEGQRDQLWLQTRESKSKAADIPDIAEVTESMRNRAIELTSIGLPGKACKALRKKPPAQVSPAVVDEMKIKHPTARAAINWADLRRVHGAAAFHIDEDSVRKAIRSFPKDSGAGPSGLRVQHLRDAMVPGFEDELIRQLTALVNILAKGQAPMDCQPFLCGAGLMALPKEDDSHRPIAVGEVLRRLVGKCLLASVKEDAQELLEPWQVGVGTSGGCEAVVHVCRRWLAQHSDDADRVIAQIDIKNAFNSLDRHEILASCREFFPSLTPWVDWTYGANSVLFLGTEEISSQRGVQQGDPLGPLLFSLALHRATRKVRQRAIVECPEAVDFAVFYLDDGIIGGSATSVRWFTEALITELGCMGLEVNLSKTVVTPSAGIRSRVQAADFAGWVWKASPNMKVLGAAVGDSAFCAGLVRKRRLKANALMQSICEVNDSQTALLLLRSCAGYTKLMYNARTSPRSSMADELSAFDTDVRKSLEAIMNLSLDDAAWARSQWATSISGLGLRSIARHADCAFLSSMLNTRDLQAEICPALEANVPAIREAAVESAIAAISGFLTQEQARAVTAGERVSQRMLSVAIDRAEWDAMLTSPSTPTHIKAHLQLLSLPGANEWLHAPPNDDGGLKMDSELFKLAIARRLRVPLLHEQSCCPLCGSALDAYMDHALVCGCGGDRTLRHNAIRNTVYEDARNAGIRCIKEKGGLLPPRPGDESLQGERSTNGRRPADIWFPDWRNDKAGAVDFAVTSGLRSDVLQSVISDPTVVCARYDDFKRGYLDTETQCSARNLDFLPFVMEAHSGGVGKTARRICSHIAKIGSAREGEEILDTTSTLFRRITIALHRENARAVLRRLPGCFGAEPAANPDAWVEASSWQ